MGNQKVSVSSWLYILIAAVFQSFWGIAVKYSDFGKLWQAIVGLKFFTLDFWWIALPIICYFVFGLLIVLSISKAYKLLPMSFVYAFWMGFTIIIQTAIDILYFEVPFNFYQIFFILVLLLGIVGMKVSTEKPSDILWVEKIEDEIERLDEPE